MKKKIVIFASGSGSNAQNIIESFCYVDAVEVTEIYTNRKTAGVIARAEKLNVKTRVFSKEEWEQIEAELIKEMPDLIVLAGFLLKFPEKTLLKFHNKVINIHPALLPKYGGKGMYGKFVHQAVLKNKEAETGISIHFVNENYDEGAMILQKKCSISSEDSIEDIEKKVHHLEHKWYPIVIDTLLKGTDSKFNL